MKNKLKKYIERMNKYNLWEEKYNSQNKFSSEQKIKQYIELMELAYMIVPKERIELIYKKKLERLINEKKTLMAGYKKHKEKNLFEYNLNSSKHKQ